MQSTSAEVMECGADFFHDYAAVPHTPDIQLESAMHYIEELEKAIIMYKAISVSSLFLNLYREFYAFAFVGLFHF